MSEAADTSQRERLDRALASLRLVAEKRIAALDDSTRLTVSPKANDTSGAVQDKSGEVRMADHSREADRDGKTMSPAGTEPSSILQAAPAHATSGVGLLEFFLRGGRRLGIWR